MADGEKRIKELEEITALTSNDYFVVDSSASGGKTKKYKATYITDIINNIPELVAEFEPNHYYDRDALVAHEGKVYYHNAPGASYEEFPTGYQFIQIDLTGLLSRLGFGISIQHNSSFTYNKGDYCMEDYILYRCLNDNVTGAWSSSDWERASLGYDLSSIYKPRLDEHDEQIEESLALGTASGSIASFTDGSTLPMKKLEVDIEPVQDLHGYENPWVGGSGKNKFDKTTVNEDVYINANGTLTSSQYNQDVTDYIPVIGGQSYIINDSLTSSNYSCFYDENKDKIGNVFANNLFPQTAPSGAKYLRVTFSKASVNTFMVEQGTTASSTYYPYSNICPISGWDECKVGVVGKNLFDKTMTLENGFIDASGQVVIANQYKHTQLIKIKPNTSYVGSGYLSSGSGYLTTVAYYDKNQNFISQSTMGAVEPYRMTTPQNANYLILSGNAPQANTIQLEEGTTPTAYEPYNGQTYTIDLDGTRYGGTLDVVSGVLTVDRGYVDLGTVNWDKYTNSAKTYFRTSAQIADAKKSDSPQTTHGLLCSNYKEDSWSHVIDGNGYDGNICIGWNNNAYIGISDSRYVDVSVSDFKTAMNGVQLVYELATPQTIQLTPTEVKSLLATNNVFADTGDILDATYVRNANITINELIQRIENLEG